MTAALVASGGLAELWRFAHEPGHADPPEERFGRGGLVFTEGGRWALHGRAGATELSPGRVYVAGPGEHYRCQHPHGVHDRNLFVALRPDALFTAVHGRVDPEAAALRSGPAVGALHRAPLVSAAVAGLWRRARRGDPAESLDEATLRLLLAVADATGAHRAPPRVSGAVRAAVEQAAALLGEDLARDLPLGELAARVHVSPFHLHRVFTALVGLTPLAYRRARRLDAAAELLRETGRPVARVAADVGYGSVSRFSADFRARHGVTPGTLRRPA